MSADYIRRCPTCDTENAPQVMRCVCGALLAGLDLVIKDSKASTAASVDHHALGDSATSTNSAAATQESSNAQADASSAPSPSAPLICTYEDCAQTNPPASTTCLYCNRSLSTSISLTKPGQLQSLLTLPSKLKERYRIISPLPTQGAEAELLLVQAHEGGATLVAKIYRHGIQPRADVQQRIARIDPHHRVEVLETGISEGYAFELMEYCALGSLRKRMQDGPLAGALLRDLVHELSIAIEGVHGVGLLHRDLKPENILVRSEQPLDLVLTDFGIASMPNATQHFTGAARTLPYAAPESLSGVIDGKADYWALGMIILEGALGKHPFAGLSEAVILHHLTTRNIDLSTVDHLGDSNKNIRKLLRGLLLRDPQKRWGIDEIRRWLADDPSLAEPAEHAIGHKFTEAYNIGTETCATKEQLAVALAKNWREGVFDITNGLLLAWFRDVQKDQNVVRLLLEMRFDKQLSVNVQLLKLILHLAPGIPPVWGGESIELPTILSHANRALKGDDNAALWLNKLYQYRVLETYAAAGNQEAASIVQKWNAACDQFESAWHAGHNLIKAQVPARAPDEYVNYDQMVYGNSEPSCPPMSDMHARLLAMAYDAQWSERLRKRLAAELAGLTVYCPWFAAFGDTHAMNAASLLVLESLLPEARKVAERQIKANDRQRDTDENDCRKIKQEAADVSHAIRSAAMSNLIMPDAATELRTELDRYFDLLTRINASGRSDTEWQAIRRSVNRSERVMSRLQMLIDALIEHRAVNAGWLSMQTFGFAGLAMLLMPIIFDQSILYWIIAATVAIIAWRLLPNYSLMKQIREQAERI